MTHKEKAVNYFSQKLHCFQAILVAFAKKWELQKKRPLSFAVVLAAVCERGKL